MARKKTDRADELLAALVKGKSPEEILGEGGVLELLTERLVEHALEGEMTEHLGYEPHAADGKGTGNSRNARSEKTIHTDIGSVEQIEVLRDRAGTFDPKLVPTRQRRLEGFDDKILSLYARGMTTREIQGHLKDLYGTEISPALISNVTDVLLKDVEAWRGRPWDSIYPIVYLDALHLKLRLDGLVQMRAVSLALGVNLEGRKELLGPWIGEKGGSKFWLSILTEPRNRGVRDILIACVDGPTGFPDAIGSEFPRTEVRLCIVQMVRNSLRYVSWKGRKVAWRRTCARSTRRTRSNSIQSQLRRVTRQRGAFPTPESVQKVLYLAIDKISERRSRPIKDWVAALNHFSIVFEDRIPT